MAVGSGGGSCRLTLLQDAQVPGVLPGIDLQAQPPIAAPNYFSCCSGTGLRLDERQDVTYACALAQRLRLLRQTATQWQTTAPDQFQAQWPLLANEPEQLLVCRRRLAAMAGGHAARGLAWTGPRPGLAVSPWTIAVTAAWRFALKPHVVILKQTKAGEILPPAGAPAPQIICIGNVDGLWEPHIAEQLETLINFAYASLIPVYLEVVPRAAALAKGGPATAASATGFRRPQDYVKDRVAGLKAKPPLSWLEPGTIDKLPYVTDGVGPFVAAAKRQKAAGQPRAPQPIRLPWDRA
ncbi:MAG: hypothetical protein FJ146_16400 [Deltaproteobacteria bacterium]|nr:hypothetical protein [Deltaproteobacteria bacterium]